MFDKSVSKNTRESASSTLEQRGLFWWHEEILPENALAPSRGPWSQQRIESCGVLMTSAWQAPNSSVDESWRFGILACGCWATRALGKGQ